MLMLISALVLAFFSAATSERAVDRSFSHSGAVRNLSDTALQLTMAQLADATAGGEPNSTTKKPDPSKPLAWASQPGMIRTYNSSGPYRYYKLYSALEMTANAASFSIADDAPPNSWRQTPGAWTDLNEPVVAASGALSYPILDPAALTLSGTGVQGFSITNAPGYSNSAAASGTNNPAPMPVRWLYQLKNGALVSATMAGTITLVPGASGTNPIVGRIAFWTDDETCKVNINTAAEGTYWDTPRFGANSPLYTGTFVSAGQVIQSKASAYPDYSFACYPPALYEFQRYPGHPAQVALSTIFPQLTGSTAAGITPRLVWGGSLGGTARASGTIKLSDAPRKAPYASVDEFQFSGASVSPRAVNNVGNALTQADLEAAKFFITANSRAPEVNLFNQPRIACWPVDKELTTNPSSSRTTAYDRLIAFCSTTRNDLGAAAYRYYFQRSDPQSPTNDYDGIQRNRDLYSYLQRLTSQAVPGFGGNFLAKYGNDRNQILTEIFDYIRCVNLHDPALSVIATSKTLMPAWSKETKQFVQAMKFPAGRANSNTELGMLGQVMPIRIGSTMGFGRFANIKEAGLVFVCVGDGALPNTSSITSAASLNTYLASGTSKLTADETKKLISNIPAKNGSGIPATAPLASGTYLYNNPPEWTRLRQKWIDWIAAGTFWNPALCGTALAPDERRVQIMVLYRLSCPAAGMTQLSPDLIVQMEGLENFGVSNARNISGGGALFASNPNSSGWYHKVSNFWARVYSNPLYFDSLLTGGGNPAGYRTPVSFPGYQEPYQTAPNSVWAAKPTASSLIPAYYPFVSQAFTITNTEKIQFAAMNNGAGNLSIRIYQAKNAYDQKDPYLGSDWIQPGAPTIDALVADGANLYQKATMQFPNASFPAPTLYTGSSTGYRIEDRLIPRNAGTWVVTPNDCIRAVCYKGDARLAAVTKDIPITSFTTYPSYENTSSQSSENQLFNDNTASGFKSYPVGGAGTQTYSSGVLPPNTTITTGDFDIACRIDPGGFINKPDEGDGNLNNGSPPYYLYNQSSTNTNFYTPNRIMPSPGMFGSLPTGALNGSNWQTLLFRPQPSHPSYSTTIPDHLMMDLFWMPVVEPYAISEPFSTAGKINMNYQIMPFTYINRSTGLLSAMKVEMQAAVPNGTVDKYLADPMLSGKPYRKTLNLSETNGTLRQFKAKFDSGNIFRSASEICDIYLVPEDQSWSSDSAANSFWSNNLNTPENLREKPYTNLYARLTTKSNTYTVHVRAQVLQKVPSTPADQWVEGRDRIVAEDRSSTLIERYVDTEDTSLPDFATDSSSPLLSDHYRMRVLSTKRLAP